MTCFVDTSALYAVMDASDRYHARAAKYWRELLLQDVALVTSNYVLLEMTALLQNRLGLEAVEVFRNDICPLLQVEWVDERTHETSLEAVLLSGRKDISLVDCASFQIMQRMGLKQVFAFDRHFKERGFLCVP